MWIMCGKIKKVNYQNEIGEMFVTRLDWIKEKISNNCMDYKLVQEGYYQDYCDMFGNVELKSFYDIVRRTYNTMCVQKNDVDEDFDIERNIKLEKNLQKKADLTTYLRRNNRNEYRLLNYTEELYDTLIKKLDDVKFDIPNIKEVKIPKENKSAILCLSDLHFGTLIHPYDNCIGYDFTIISKRLKKYISTAIKTMKANEVGTVYLANLGDIVSASHRSDEKLGTVSAQTNCILVAVTILEQIVAELCKEFKVIVTGIVGNESRLGVSQEFFEYHKMNLENNADRLVLTMLKHVLDKKIKNLSFIIPPNPMKHMLEIPINNGKETYRVVLAHGNMIKSLKDGCENVYTNEYTDKNIKVNAVLLGHWHHLGVLSNGKTILCGTTMEGNVYANALGLVGKAFQNLIIINNDHTYWNLPINLSDVSEIKDEYKFDKELENCAYNRITDVSVVDIKISYN